MIMAFFSVFSTIEIGHVFIHPALGTRLLTDQTKLFLHGS